MAGPAIPFILKALGLLAAGLGIAGGVTAIVGTTRDKTEVKPNAAACTCDDLVNMISRRDLANVATKSIDDLSKAQSAKDSQAGKPEKYSDELYGPGKQANEDAIAQAKTGAPPGGGETHHLNCSPKFPDGVSACMKESLRAHENVHQRECVNGYTTRFANYKEAKTMVEYWAEDREGYQEEVNFLEPLIAKCLYGNYAGPQSKEEQQQRLAASKRRATQYVAGIPALRS
jgi:hypothetical protein